ncbi:hypothetical protein BaRGS_00029209, partial [Batillaria attramentaria]
MKWLLLPAVFLVLQVCLTGVNAGEGDVNDACKAGKTCTLTTVNTCDAKATGGPKCLTMVDQNCAQVGECITNAVCASNGGACHCAPDFVAITNKTACQAKAGVNCSSDSDCAAGSTCSAEKKCTCDVNKVSNRVDSVCKLKEGQTCTTTDECGTNAQCSTGATKTCTCKTGFAKDSEGRCGVVVGGSCSDDNKCVSFASCTSTCACVTGYAANADKICLKEVKVGEDCTNGVCVTGSSCPSTGDKVCKCDEHKLPATDNSFCRLAKGQTCTGSGSSECGVNAQCDGTSKKCVCKPDMVDVGDGRCGKGVEATCGSDNECVPSATCSSSKCACIDGYEAKDKKCQK